MRKRQKCIECGIQVPGSVTTYRNKSGRPMLCSECLKALREQQKISKRDTIRSTLDLKCVVCGKQIPWKNSYVYKNRRPKTCSGSCHGLYAKLNYLVSKQQLIERIDKYIQSHKRYVTRQQLSKAGIAYPKQLSKHRISTLLQNKKVLGQDIYIYICTQHCTCVQNTLAQTNLADKIVVQYTRCILCIVNSGFVIYFFLF